MDIGGIAIVADALKIAVDLIRGVGGEFRWHFFRVKIVFVYCRFYSIYSVQTRNTAIYTISLRSS